MRKKLTGVVIMLVVGLFILFTAACDDVHGKVSPEGTVIEPQNFGQSIYYFPTSSESLATSLSRFKAEHPSLKVVAMASKNTGAYGSTVGYWVVFEEKE